MAIVHTDGGVGCGDAPKCHATEEADGDQHAEDPDLVVFSLKRLACNVYPFQIEDVPAAN